MSTRVRITLVWGNEEAGREMRPAEEGAGGRGKKEQRVEDKERRMGEVEGNEEEGEVEMKRRERERKNKRPIHL